MFNMEELMKSINKQQLDNFTKCLNIYRGASRTMNRQLYLSIYLGNFLGNYFKLPLQTQTDEKFNSFCHKVIDKISLCSEEIEFFHKMVDVKEADNYINKWIELYNSIENLKNCQLGENILKCIELSKHLSISK
jgi:hypothetical protein